jgi:hypothetical protein
MPDYVYREMGPAEEALDWRITRTVMGDPVLMKLLQDSQSGGEKHAIVAVVENGVFKEAYVSPERAVKEMFPFNAIRQAFDYYTTGGGVCLVIVRDNAVAVSLNGLMGKN